MKVMTVLDELPEGYAVERGQGAIAAVHADYAEALAAAGWSATSDPVLAESALRGRRPLLRIDLEDEQLLVRRFSHGGLLRWATGARFRDPERPFREIVLSEHLRAHGLATPRVVAARARAYGGVGWRLEVVTRRVPGTLDLGFWLTRLQRGEVPGQEARRVVAGLGALVRRMHDSGFLHADLCPNNVLVETDSLTAETPRFWLLDLDRSLVTEPLGRDSRWNNVRRLFRHVDRRTHERRLPIPRTFYMRFLRAYESDRGLRHQAWRSIHDQHERRMRWHRLGWLFERRSAAEDPRALQPH